MSHQYDVPDEHERRTEKRIEELEERVAELEGALGFIANHDRCCSDYAAAESMQALARTALEKP